MTERILVVDDHPLTRDALAGLLGQHGFDVVDTVASGEEAVERARELQPQLVLPDLTMPGLGGLAALPLLREAAPEAEVVVLTAAEDDQSLLQAIRAGAAGYLLKSEPPERIVDSRKCPRGARHRASLGVAPDQVRVGAPEGVREQAAGDASVAARASSALTATDAEEIARLFI